MVFGSVHKGTALKAAYVTLTNSHRSGTSRLKSQIPDTTSVFSFTITVSVDGEADWEMEQGLLVVVTDRANLFSCKLDSEHTPPTL